MFSLYWDCVCRLVSGAGDIKLTKDGNVLLHEMVRKYVNVKGLSYKFYFEEYKISFLGLIWGDCYSNMHSFILNQGRRWD